MREPQPKARAVARPRASSFSWALTGSKGVGDIVDLHSVTQETRSAPPVRAAPSAREGGVYNRKFKSCA